LTGAGIPKQQQFIQTLPNRFFGIDDPIGGGDGTESGGDMRDGVEGGRGKS